MARADRTAGRTGRNTGVGRRARVGPATTGPATTGPATTRPGTTDAEPAGRGPDTTGDVGNGFP